MNVPEKQHGHGVVAAPAIPKWRKPRTPGRAVRRRMAKRIKKAQRRARR